MNLQIVRRSTLTALAAGSLALVGVTAARAQSSSNGVYGGFVGSSRDLYWTTRIAIDQANARRAHERLNLGHTGRKHPARSHQQAGSWLERVRQEDREKGFFRIPAGNHREGSRARARRASTPAPRWHAPAVDHSWHAPVSDHGYKAPVSDHR